MEFKKSLFCNKCGKKVDEGTNFCKNCGNKIIRNEDDQDEYRKEVEQIQEDNSGEFKLSYEKIEDVTDEMKEEITEDVKEEIIEISNEENNSIKVEEYKPKSSKPIKSSKAILGIIFGIIILAFVAFIGLEVFKKTVNDPEKLVKKFQISIAEENYDDLEKIVKSSDIRLEINEENLKNIVAYFKSNPSQLSDKCKELNKIILVGSENNSSISIEKETGISGVLGKYSIVVYPVFLRVETKLDNTKVMLNGKEFESLDQGDIKELGPLMPGEYEVVSKYDGDYISLENKVKKDLISNDNEICSLFSSIRGVGIDTEYNNAIVIVNGKNTGKTVEELSYKLSPIDDGTKIQLELDVEGKKFTTSEKIVGDNNRIYFENIKDVNQYMERKTILDNFEKNIDNEVINLMNEYSRGFESAVNYRNFSYLTRYLYPNSELFKAQQDYINLSATNNVYENFISLSIKNINYDSDNTSGTVDVTEVYESITNGKSKKDTYYYNYSFKYNETEKIFQLTDMVNQ